MKDFPSNYEDSAGESTFDSVSLHQGRSIDEAETAQQSVASQIISTLCYGHPDFDDLDR